MKVLRKKPRNKEWTIDERLSVVKRFLANEPIVKISLQNNLNPSLISFWTKKYLESGISGLELNRGRSIMKSKISNNKSTKVSNNSDSQDKSNSSLSVYEELKLLKKENEVLKKWKAIGKDLWLKSTKARKNKKNL
ncbi:hypothetical protein CIB43_00721 [Mesomycoplasma hyopneumoniae]|uniref:Transposase n=1 Tax=Mesomycoplasma hyopneumoniae TaxID=2099 RepID=A0A223MB04_MESHO|nr:hypothetical protein CIB43_00721 [Mesomycoplasma hyopneumoniae]